MDFESSIKPFLPRIVFGIERAFSEHVLQIIKS